MAAHLTLLCHAGTRSMRTGAFADPREPLDEGGQRKAAQALPAHGRAFTSPAEAARQTAATMGLSATPDDRLRDRSMGLWTGRSFEDVQAEDPEGLTAWLADPAAAVPGGEALEEVRARMAGWLAEQAARDEAIIAITHPMVVRAALSAALDLPLASVLRFDIAPLSATVLSYNRLWRLQAMGRP